MENKAAATWDTELDFLAKEMEEVAGEWNGDEPGLQEERSTLASDIAEKARELRSLISEFSDL